MTTMYRDAFDCEVLIAEVEKRPALYDSANPEYLDKIKKMTRWTEVCQGVYENWNELKEYEKEKKSKDVQKRWKGLRDCFRKVILDKRAPRQKPKRRKYVYYNQLRFMIPIILDQPRPSPPVSPTLGVLVETEDGSPVKVEPKPLERVAKPEKSEHENQNSVEYKFTTQEENNYMNEVLLKLKASRKRRVEDIDDDKAFLMSLLPLMKKFTDRNKLNARVEILNAIRRVHASVTR